jgi:hypothetical protein
MARNESAVPQRGRRPTQWQQDVGKAIAEAYGVASFDPETFVCRGDGRPIGFPLIEMDVAPEEWEVFRPVDRRRGDSLLGICWMPAAPTAWTAP